MQQVFSRKSFFRQLIVLCCLLFSINSWSQIYEAWAKRYNDPGTVMDFGQAIATDAAGNVYVTGRSEFAWSPTVMSADITTIKYDSQGNQVWVKKYNSPFDRWDDAVDIAVDAAGNIIITGSSRSTNHDDIITIKYNSSGDQLWAARYDGPQHGSDWGSALALDASGNIYVTGQRDGNEGRAFADIVTIKYNSQGVQQWAMSYAGAAANSSDAANAIVVPGNGFVYITGKMFESATHSDCITLKYSTAGALAWIRNFDGPSHGDDYASDIAVDGSGNVYITGSTMNQTTFWDFLTVKYDANGNQKWYKSIHETTNDHGRNIAIDKSDNIVIAGDGGGGLDKPMGAYYTIKMDPAATVWWTRFFNPENCTSYYGDMTLDNDDNIYVTGGTKRENCQRTYYGTVKYYPNGSPHWQKFYTGPGASSRANAIAVDAKDRVYITGQSLEGAEGHSGTGNWSFATIKYSKCLIACPANITVNNTPGQCGAIVNYPAATTTGDCGNLQYSKASATFFPVGVTTVTVSSAASGESCSFTVTVKDAEAPKITCPASVTVSCAADVPPVKISTVTATDNCSAPVVTHVSDVISNQTCTNRFTLTRTYKATDASGNTASCSQVITVFDNTPPQLSGLSLSKNLLWPPDHSMRNITVNYAVSDNCVANVPAQITITSNEPVNGTGDGDAAPDWEVLDAHHIRLRAERAGLENDRIYTITVTVDDGCNAPVSQSQQVLVPHNMFLPRGAEQEVIIPSEKVERLQLMTYPNPSTHDFTVIMKSHDVEAKASLMVYDQQGRLVEKKEQVAIGSIVKFGANYKSGVYYLKVRQGNQEEQVKLVKLSQ